MTNTVVQKSQDAVKEMDKAVTTRFHSEHLGRKKECIKESENTKDW